MRNPDRLKDFYRQVEKIHRTKFPDWRYGQFCCNFFGWLYSEKGLDPFFPEEAQMIKYLKEYAKIEDGDDI